MPFVALDLETTGLEHSKDKIIEIAIVKFDEKTFEILDTFTSLVNPGIHIPELNANITGITDETIKEAPFFSEIIEQVQNFIADAPIVGHNIQFDIRFLTSNGVNLQNNGFIDTFFLANSFLSSESSISLESLCYYFGVPLLEAHRALHDTKASVQVFQKLVGYFLDSLSQEEKVLFHYALGASSDTQIVFLKDFFFSQIPEPQFETIKKIILKKVDFYKPRTQLKVKKVPSVENCFKKLSSMEKRDNQLSLVSLIEENFKTNKKSVIEASTGIGKTLAYCLPALRHSLLTGEQIFISTKSKILQDQLYLKDLKNIHDSLGLDFSYVKVKGQENYISLQLFFPSLSDKNQSYEKVSFMSKMVLWLYKSTDGELDELNYYSEETSFVKYISSNLEEAFSDSNPYKEYEFLYKSRRSVETANIVIINHALLFAESRNKGEIFQKIHNLVIDEAHSLEDIATSGLKRRYNLRETKYLLGEILTKARKNGFTQSPQLSDQIGNLVVKLEYLNDLLGNYFTSLGKSETDYSNILVKDGVFFEEKIQILTDDIEGTISSICDTLKLSNSFSKEIFILQEILSVFEIVFDIEKKSEYIQMASYHSNSGLTLEYTTLDIADFCKKNIWGQVQNVFLLSATLRVGESFDFFKRTLGLDENIYFYNFESDFDYSQQAELILVKDLGSIKNNFREMVYFLKNLLGALRGNTLVLFTSFSLIRSCYLELNSYLKREGIILLAQGLYGSKYRILDKFKEKSDNHVIFGTDSFWEGIDIPGDDLKYLIIHKFPFAVPTDPVFIARSTLFQDAFEQYAIPKAIIKLKQGMGRLIRTKSDTGKIILLDDRITSTQWGKNFYNSFPKDIKISTVSSKDIISSIQ